MRWRSSKRQATSACTGRRCETDEPGRKRAREPTCCGPIYKPIPRPNSGRNIFNSPKRKPPFGALKSELSIRPLFHRLERRVKAHILVAFLGYALWVTLKHL